MPLAVPFVPVDLRVESGLHLPGGAAEFDRAPAGRDFRHLESLGLEPGGNHVEIGLRRTELLPELFRREPRMIARRGGVLLVC